MCIVASVNKKLAELNAFLCDILFSVLKTLRHFENFEFDWFIKNNVLWLIQNEYLNSVPSGITKHRYMRRGIFSVHLFLELLANLTSNAFASGFLLAIPLNIHALTCSKPFSVLTIHSKWNAFCHIFESKLFCLPVTLGLLFSY